MANILPEIVNTLAAIIGQATPQANSASMSEIAPQTPLGKTLEALLLLLRKSLIIVPIALIALAVSQHSKRGDKKGRARVCKSCMALDHQGDAVFCERCGSRLEEHWV